MTDTIHYPLSAVAEQCPTCRIWTDDAANCTHGHVEQPPPTPASGPAIADLVREDISGRDRLGVQRYGERLRAGNGRDALRDAYEEALDLAMYLRQLIEEREAKRG